MSSRTCRHFSGPCSKRSVYVHVLHFSLTSWSNFSQHTNYTYRSLKLILKSFQQTTEVLIWRKKICSIFTKKWKATWTSKYPDCSLTATLVIMLAHSMPAWSCSHSLYDWICSGFSAAWYARIPCLIPIASRTSLMRLSLQVRSFFLIAGVLTFQIIVIPLLLYNWTPEAPFILSW